MLYNGNEVMNMDAKTIEYIYYSGFFGIAIAFYLESFIFDRTKIKFLIKTAIIFGYVFLGSHFGIF